MAKISGANLLEQMQWRYAVKKFDASKKVSAGDWQALEQALILSPSSYGLQPWKFLIVNNPEVRTQLRAVSWNQSQVTDCSHYVVMAHRETMTEADIQRFVDKMVQVRGVDAASLEGYRKAMIGDVVQGPRNKMIEVWASRQVYIALGNLMTCAAVLGIDTCPMEGLDPAQYDKILGLAGTGYKTVVACAVGYRSTEDGLASAKKVRYSSEEVIQRV